MIFGQIGTAFAVHTQSASRHSAGILSNRYLLLAIAGEIAVAALFVYAPPLQSLLGTTPPPVNALLLLLPFPVIVWGADQLRRFVLRGRSRPPLATRSVRRPQPVADEHRQPVGR